ncbi:hypothetical protein PMAYCL1PPCAC_01552, partial [Pristionchus mayeri]
MSSGSYSLQKGPKEELFDDISSKPPKITDVMEPKDEPMDDFQSMHPDNESPPTLTPMRGLSEEKEDEMMEEEKMEMEEEDDEGMLGVPLQNMSKQERRGSLEDTVDSYWKKAEVEAEDEKEEKKEEE